MVRGGEAMLLRSIKAGAVVLLVGSPATAEQIQFKIVDVLWLDHQTRGGGVEIVYQFDRKPGDGEDAIKAFALSECNRVAKKYVPMALEKTGKSKADFVSIQLRFGGAVGSYIKYFAKYDEGVCSDLE
jgi:hypothetical protein